MRWCAENSNGHRWGKGNLPLAIESGGNWGAADQFCGDGPYNFFHHHLNGLQTAK